MTPREALVLHWPQILTCDGTRCRKNWSAAVHRKGQVDSFGYIHSSRLDQNVNARGLYGFLLLVIQARASSYRDPQHHVHKLYGIHTWASWALRAKFGRRASVAWSAKDRERAWRLTRIMGTGTDPTFRSWVNDGLRYLAKRGRRTYLRRPVTREEEDQWVALRYTGVTYAEIARRAGRSQKVVWSHLRARGLTG
jgi:hypothetical protein